MAAKQVSQSTFDAIVREAMTDFDLSAEEAVIDAREQLSMAGITDFSNLIDPNSADSGALLSEYATISTHLKNAVKSTSTQDVIHILQKIAGTDEKTASVAGGNGAVEAVTDSLEFSLKSDTALDISLVSAACDALWALCVRNEANRTRFAQSTEPDGVTMLCTLLQRLESAVDENMQGIQSVLSALAAVQRKCEGVKQRVAAGKNPDMLLSLALLLAERVCVGEASMDVFRTVCRVFRQLLAADDVSVTVAETFVRARLFSGVKIVTESGLRPLSGETTLVDVLSNVVKMGNCAIEGRRVAVLKECISVARFFAVSDDICQELSNRGVVELAVGLLGEMKEDREVVCACLGLLRNLAGRDECKSRVFEGMETICETVEVHFRVSDAIAEVFCALVSGLCLRRGDIGRTFVESGVIKMVLDAMEGHEESIGVLKAGCLVVRNAASKDESARCSLVAGGRAEAIVRRVWRKFPGACDVVAYSALQELDVLAAGEMKRDERYTMPPGFYQREIVRKGDTRF